MKKIIVLITSLLLFISTFLNVNIVMADDEEITQDLIDEWTSIVDSLGSIYLEDLSDVEFVKSDIENDKTDLVEAKSKLEDSKQKAVGITETYNNALKEKEDADTSVTNKENEIKTIEASLNTNIEEERTKLETLKKAEEEAGDKALNVAPSNDEEIEKLKDEYETSVLTVGNVEYQLNQAKANVKKAQADLVTIKADGIDFVIQWQEEYIAELEASVTSLESLYAEKVEERDTRKQKYDDALANKDLITKEAEEALEKWNSAKEALDAQQKIVDDLEAELATNNENLSKLKEELGFLQIDQADKDDAYIKAKEAYDDVTLEVSGAETLVSMIEESISEKETLLEICNEDLNDSKEAYDNATAYLASIKETYRNNKLNELKEEINKEVDLNLYKVDSVNYYNAILEDSTSVYENSESTTERIVDALANIKEAYSLLVKKDKSSAPTTSLSEGTYTSGQIISLTPGEGGNNVVYKINDEQYARRSTSDNRIELKGEIGKKVEYTITAITIGEGDYSNSDVATFKYTIEIDKPGDIVINNNTGKINNPEKPSEEAKQQDYSYKIEITHDELDDNAKAAISQNKDVSIELIIKEDSDKKEEVSSILKEDNKYELGTTLDISLVSKITVSNDEVITNTITQLKEEKPAVITIPVPEDCLINDETIERTYKVLRIHDGVVDYLDGDFDEENNTFTFKTDRFSTYALVYEDTLKNTKKEDSDTSSSDTGSTSEAVKSCEEAIGRNWTWSTISKTCVYKVTNTSSK